MYNDELSYEAIISRHLRNMYLINVKVTIIH